MQSFLQEKLPTNPSENAKEKVFKEIWERAKSRGAIETPSGGRYEKETEKVGGNNTIDYWYTVHPSGSRDSQPHFESRMYSGFIKDKLEKYWKEVKENKRESQNKNAKPEKGPEITVDDSVRLTEGGIEREVVGVGEIAGDYYVKLQDGRAVRVDEVKKAQSAKEQKDMNKSRQQDTNSEDGSERKNQTEQKPKGVDNYLTREGIRQIIGEHKSASAAAEQILSHDGFYWDEQRYIAKTKDGLWQMRRRDGATENVRAFFDTEMASRMLQAVSDHEKFSENKKGGDHEQVPSKVDRFVDGVTEVMGAIIAATPEGESTTDEKELRLSFEKLRRLTDGGHSFTPTLLHKYRDRFAQTVNYFRNNKPETWQSANIDLEKVRTALSHIDDAVENLRG